MSGRSFLGSGFWLGFDGLEQSLANVAKYAAENWPPYNVEQIGDDRLQVTLAVAGFDESELQITLDQNHLMIHGKKQEQTPENERIFLHRGIATRQFQRHFILGQDIKLECAELSRGLLILSLSRPPPQRPKQITIKNRAAQSEDKIQLAVAKSV